MQPSIRPQFPRDPHIVQWLVLSVVLWITFSFVLYLFADGIKEMFRLVTGLLGPQEFLHLTAEEQRFYKIFYAALSLVIAFGHFSKQFLQRPTLRRGDFRYSKSAILFEQTFLGNYTLHIFTKLAVMYGSFLWAVPVFLQFDFYEHRFLMLLLPLVIFLSQWLSLNRIFKRHAIKWMGLSLLSIAALSLIFSRISTIHYSAVDKVILKNHPLTYYNLDLPKPGSEAFIRYSRNINRIYASIYIAKLKAGQDRAPKIFVNKPPFNPATKSELATYLAEVRNGLAEHEQNQLGIALFVDKHTPMKYVKRVRSALSEAGINVVFFALRNHDVRYSHDNEFYFVQRRVPSFCNSLYREGKKNKFFSSEGEIDSLTDEELDYKSSLFTVIKDNKIFVNGVEMNLSQLHDELERFMDLNHQSRRVIFYADDTSRYDFYLMVYNLLLMARNDFGDQYFAGRHRFSFRKALKEKKPYDCGSEYMKAINEFHTTAGPFLREITDEERNYMLSKYPALRTRLTY